jgi:hypothetical protein
MNMRLLVVIYLTLGIASCQKSHQFNPFDEDFSITEGELTSLAIDTLGGDCGYWLIVINDNKSLIEYYQIHEEENYYYTPSWIRNSTGISRVYLGYGIQVVGKGFTCAIDTFSFSSTATYDSMHNSLKNNHPSPILTSYMSDLGYNLVDSEYDHYFLY